MLGASGTTASNECFRLPGPLWFIANMHVQEAFKRQVLAEHGKVDEERFGMGVEEPQQTPIEGLHFFSVTGAAFFEACPENYCEDLL